MSYKLIRFVCILVALAALAGFAQTFLAFMKEKDRTMRPFPVGELVEDFERADPHAHLGHIPEWNDAFKVVYASNLTGQVEKADTGPAPPPKPRARVKPSDLEVPYVQFDRPGSPVNLAYIRPADYRPDPKDLGEEIGDLYSVGDRFEIPTKEGVELEVAEIRQREVDITILDAPEGTQSLITVATPDFEVETSAVMGTGEAGRLPITTAPKETRRSLTDPDQYEVGTEDMEAIGAMSDEQILAAVDVAPERDRETGQVRGLRIQSIQEDSVFARQGLESEDLLLSVNGQPATDRSELLGWARRQKDLDRIEVQVERYGSVRTLTYRIPRR